ncbi:hypothetical protein SAMN05428944_1357 [Streptomyces sp. 1222.5]|uniref:antibiotic biosynthesis monooxygenase n=1 Tax=unclassified Streptomyces TaxID=2593676 RepID=UPI0008979DC3|nr:MULTISPECIES: antibiotic biosynthesis monooxygenase [unclassified Streptomyces]PKW11425.1 hypothetical protein BX260_6737 [Streptomyces sp. 5112.2]SEB79332.1 hypothetical protein SAMN05428944_1357 [Streptomyces sp. 1222.5]
MSAGRSVATAATAIIGQKVLPGMEREFEAWQENLNAAAARYPGFLGAEISPPTPLQPDWLIVYRFDSVAHLQAWINSSTRQTYLDSGAQYFDGPATQKVVGSGTRSPDPLVTVVVTHRVPPHQVDDFLAWQQHMVQEESRFDGVPRHRALPPRRGAPGGVDHALSLRQRRAPRRPADVAATPGDPGRGGEVQRLPAAHDRQLTRTSLAIWVGLLVGNLLSSLLMSFLTMPYYVNPLLGRWLRPPRQEPALRTNLRCLGIVAVAMAFWALDFYWSRSAGGHCPGARPARCTVSARL